MKTILSTALVVAVLAMSCASNTKLVQSWRDPGTTLEKGHFKKMLCIALVKDETNRRAAEDKLVSLMPGHASQSYIYLGALPDSVDGKALTARAIKDGFDGVLIMRLTKVEKNVSYVPGAYPAAYYHPWGYYGYGYGMYADPGYVRTDNYYYIETNLYDLPKDKLIWSGITSTWEPSNVSDIVQDVANTVVQKMRTEGFIVQ